MTKYKMVTRKEVAKLAGVSVATVSNVLGKRLPVSEKKTQRVLQAVKQLKYTPNYTAKSLSLGKTRHVAVIINDYYNSYHMEVAKAIGAVLTKHGFMMTIVDLSESSICVEQLLTERQFDALVNLSSNLYTEDFLTKIKERGILLINFSGVQSFEVKFDLCQAQKECMQALQKLNHKHVGYVSSIDAAWFMADDRGKTFLAERDNFGFVANDDYITYGYVPSQCDSEVGYQQTKALLTKHPEITALFATNDMTAFGVLRALQDLGLHCPKDVSVIGCDDILTSKYFIPSLSSMGYDKGAFGQEIARRIVFTIDEKKDCKNEVFCLNAKPIFRDSIGEARK